MCANVVLDRELEAIRRDEASEQSKRIRVAAGAGLIGASCFFVPVLGGITLAAAGAAAAAAMTTRDDEAGAAARASGAAVASGIAKVSQLDVSTKFKQIYANTKNRLHPIEKEESKKNIPVITTASWWSRTMTVLRGGEKPRLQVYGEARTSADVAELIVRELADVPRDSRRRLALEIIASLHPDRAPPSVAAQAAANSLTRVAIAVKDYFEQAGFSAFDVRGIKAVIADVRKHVNHLG